PSLSPDGKWIAYSVTENGVNVLYVSSFPNATSFKWVVAPNGGTDPLWSHRGTEIIYRGPDQRDFMSVSVATSPTFSAGTPKLLFSSSDYIAEFSISPDDSKFL